MFGLEILQIQGIFPVTGSHLVFCEVVVVLVLGSLSLGFVRLLLFLGQALPMLPDEFCDFRECQIPALQVLSHF